MRLVHYSFSEVSEQQSTDQKSTRQGSNLRPGDLQSLALPLSYWWLTTKASQPASRSTHRAAGIEPAVRPASPPGRDRTRDMGTYNDPSPALPLSYWWLGIFGEKTTINTTSSSFLCKSAIIMYHIQKKLRYYQSFFCFFASQYLQSVRSHSTMV